jgi:hypothetical protein
VPTVIVDRVERWDTCELSFSAAQSYANPFRDVTLSATLTHALTGTSLSVNGFYDGGETWRLRVMPDQVGVWQVRTHSADPGLDGQTLEFECVPPKKPYLHGPLRVDGHHFRHADGTRRYLLSTRLSCHLEPPEVWQAAIAALSAHCINRVLFMMGGVHGTIGELYGEGPNFWRYNVERFQAIDRFVDALRCADMLAAPYFYYFNDGQQRAMTADQDRAYLRYGMARFGAYANVLPVLANEVEQKSTDRRGQYNLSSHRWANKMGPFLKELAVFGQPVTVHDPMETENAVRPSFYTLLHDWPFRWTDYMLRQAQVAALSTAPELSDEIPEQKQPVYDLRGYARHNQTLIDLRQFDQPVINEEPGYEMEGRTAFPDATDTNLRPWNSQTPDTLLATFWTAVMAGGYATWGNYATYWLKDPLPGIQRSPTPKHLRVLHDVVTALPYWEMEPMNECVSPADREVEGQLYRTNYGLAKAGEVYLIFSLLGGPLTVVPAPSQEYQVTRIDVRSGERVELGCIDGSVQEIVLPDGEQVLLLEKDG